MKHFQFISLILIAASPYIALGQPMRIPVIPFDGKPKYVSYKDHNRCKRFKNYWKCINRSEKRVTTSLDMEY